MVKEGKTILDKIFEEIKKLVNIGKEHKEISKIQEKKSMPKSEQRLWYLVSILVVILISIGFINFLSKDNSISENLQIELISPSQGVILNEEKDIDLEIKFTNIGGKDLENFDILKMDLYRVEAGNLTYKRQIIYNNKDFSGSCHTYSNKYKLKKEESCTIKTDIYSCPTCFDDKDKELYLLIYFESVPPIKNDMLNIPIY